MVLLIVGGSDHGYLTMHGREFRRHASRRTKGDGLIHDFILIGTVRPAYAINPDSLKADRRVRSTSLAASAGDREKKRPAYNILGEPEPAVTTYVSPAQDAKRTSLLLASPCQRHRDCNGRPNTVRCQN